MIEELLTQNLVPLPSPADLRQKHTLHHTAAQKISSTRRAVVDILSGNDPRMLMIVGPCSLDDTRMPSGEFSAVVFAQQLVQIMQQPEIAEHLVVIMRCPPSKPRTDVGQRGLEQKTIETSRQILTAIANLGVPLASEVMHARHMAHFGDLLTLAWTGARNGDDTHLRHMLSASKLPVICKNGSDGSLNMAANALLTIRTPHENVELTMPDGRTGKLARSAGNPHAKGLVYRGGTNAQTRQAYETHIRAAAEAAAELSAALLADASHGGRWHTGESSRPTASTGRTNTCYK